ncbi:hypothetical protein MNBD_GAMMA26-988 [hydrothermal vent metagenome]|uniref:Uncharacterized protein n=1 Tax=hydrothermal vent metagenome TaxID=652676 RepID=A0A3B1AWW6_9ZZZZ
MKPAYQILAFLLCFGLMASVLAADPADNIIKNAQIDIARFEQQANGLTPTRSSNARRILKLLNLSHQRLQNSQNQDHPSWQEVNQRFVSLKSQLEGLLKPGATSAATAAPANSAPATRMAAPASAPGNNVPELVSGQRVRVKKLTRDMDGISQDLVTTGPSPLQTPAEVAALKKRIDQFAKALSRYPQLNDPDVQAARASFKALTQKLNAEFQRSKQQLKQLGDVQQRLATLEKNSRTYAPPKSLAIPFSKADAQAWVDAAGKARTVAEHNLKELQAIAPIAYLPQNPGTPQTGAPYDTGDVRRLQNNAMGMLDDVEQGYQSMAKMLKDSLNGVERNTFAHWEEDPLGEKSGVFLGASNEKNAMDSFARGLAIAQSSIYLEQALGRDAPDAHKIAGKIEQAKKDFIRNQDIALSASRMPESKSKDSKLLAIAREILENPKYEYGEFSRIVLTTEGVVERERKDSELEIDDAKLTLGGDLKMSGTQTTWTYKWQEFKFAASLKENDSDKWYIWWITAKNFSSGGSKTPLNKWISGKSSMGNPILKKNI